MGATLVLAGVFIGVGNEASAATTGAGIAETLRAKWSTTFSRPSVLSPLAADFAARHAKRFDFSGFLPLQQEDVELCFLA